MEHPDNPLLDVALDAIRERSTVGNPIQIEHIAIAVEAAVAAALAPVAALADQIATEWVAPTPEEQVRLTHIATELRAVLGDPS